MEEREQRFLPIIIFNQYLALQKIFNSDLTNACDKLFFFFLYYYVVGTYEHVPAEMTRTVEMRFMVHSLLFNTGWFSIEPDQARNTILFPRHGFQELTTNENDDSFEQMDENSATDAGHQKGILGISNSSNIEKGRKASNLCGPKTVKCKNDSRYVFNSKYERNIGGFTKMLYFTAYSLYSPHWQIPMA